MLIKKKKKTLDLNIALHTGALPRGIIPDNRPLPLHPLFIAMVYFLPNAMRGHRAVFSPLCLL